MDTSSTPSKPVFHSNLFGSFGAGLFVPPNTIDFGSVFDNFAEKLVENMPVVATVVGVIILFIPLAVICRKFDKKDALKVNKGCLCLNDNNSRKYFCATAQQRAEISSSRVRVLKLNHFTKLHITLPLVDLVHQLRHKVQNSCTHTDDHVNRIR